MINLLKVVFLAYFCLFSTHGYTSVGANDNSSLTKKTILTVAIEETDYFPFNYTENGTVKGFSVELLDYIEANSQYDFEFVMLPWRRVLHFAEQGKVDIILTLFKKPEREKRYHFIEPSYGFEVNQLFALRDHKFKYNGTLQQLSPYTIGTKSAYSYGEKFDKADYLDKLPTVSEDVLLKLLLGKRVDFMIGNPFQFNRLIAERNLQDKVVGLKPYVEITPVYMALTKQRKDAQQIKSTLEKLSKQFIALPLYKELLIKHKLNF